MCAVLERAQREHRIHVPRMLLGSVLMMPECTYHSLSSEACWICADGSEPACPEIVLNVPVNKVGSSALPMWLCCIGMSSVRTVLHTVHVISPQHAG